MRKHSLFSISVFKAINKAIQKPHEEFSIGVLDIYGFEIFQVCPVTHVSANEIQFKVYCDVNPSLTL